MDTTWLCANCRELVIKDAEELFCTECAPLLPCRKCTAKDVQIALMLDTQAKENMRIDNLCAAKDAELSRLRAIEARLTVEGVKQYLLENIFFPVGSTVTNDHRVAYEVSKAVLRYLRGEGK